MTETSPVSVVIIGQGNEFRGDDGAGPEVIRRLKAIKFKSRARVKLFSGPVDIARIIEFWDGAKLAIFIDAAISDNPPGTIHIFSPLTSPIPEELQIQSTTHDAPSVTQAVELGRALGRLPKELIVYAIDGREFSSKAGIIAEVEKAVGLVVENISQKLHHFLSE